MFVFFRTDGLLSFNEFRPGSIHDPQFYKFWEEVLEAPAWILEILREGYKIPFKTLPGPYMEPNNKTARDNPQVVRKIVAEMIQKGIARMVKNQPLVVSPLGLVSKIQEDGSTKHRLVFDASRHVNLHVDLPHVRLNHLDRALELTRKDDWQIVYDLSSAYYHISIAEEHRKYLGACFQNSDGSNVFFEYCHLPFGLSSAVHIITKIWKPLTQYLNKNGIRNTIYIDDGRILGSSQEEIQRMAVFTYNTVTQAGWAVEPSKSDMPQAAAKSKKYLGFHIDSERLEVKAPDSKLKKLAILLKDFMEQDGVHVKHLAKILGNIIALEPSHGMLARVVTRSGYSAIAAHTEERGWQGVIKVTESMRREFQFLLDNLDSRNGSPIKSTLFEVKVESILDNPVTNHPVLQNHVRGDQIFVSDSSDFKTFVYELTQGGVTVLSSAFNREQREMSSGARELLALSFTLKQWKLMSSPVKKKIVYWVTDSENVVSFLKKGSRKEAIQAILFDVVLDAHDLEVQIEPIHLLRQDPRIQIADEGSKQPDSDNWSIDDASFSWILEKFPQMETDMFADASNRRLKKFCSLYYSPDTWAVDAYSACWKSLGFLWLCPPVSCLIKTHWRIMCSECEGVLVLPVWKTSSFYGLFFEGEMVPKPPFVLVRLWHPYIIQNENARRTPLFGSVPFSFAALYFSTLK